MKKKLFVPSDVVIRAILISKSCIKAYNKHNVHVINFIDLKLTLQSSIHAVQGIACAEKKLIFESLNSTTSSIPL